MSSIITNNNIKINTDYKFNLFFASCEINYRCIKDTHTKNWLVSFYYLRDKSHAKLIEFLEDAKNGLKRITNNPDAPQRKLFLDSGAFSFQNAAGCIAGRNNNNKTELNTNALLKYTYDYLDFINVYGRYFDIIAEIDVDYLIGVRKTRYLYNVLKRATDLGIRELIRPVWHIPRGTDQWAKDCADNSYVGIEGHSRHKDDPISFYNQMLDVSRSSGCKVHGFAFTHAELLKRIPFDSVDSASWMLQAANGTVKTPFGTISISARQMEQAELDGTLNYQTMSTIEKAKFENYVKQHGFTIDEVIGHWLPRASLNTYYYTWLEDEINRHWDKLKAKKVYQNSIFDLKGLNT